MSWHLIVMMIALVAIGILGGVLTTVTGVGGGMVALSLVALLVPPAEALALTAAALAIGNGHRLVLFRRDIDRRVITRFGIGLAVGALIGARLVTSVPTVILHGALIAVATLALARVVTARPWSLPPNWLVATGAVIGAVGAGAGGAGVLIAPVLLAAGVRGNAYVATVAACAIILNGARVVGYAGAGLYQSGMVPPIATLAVALVVGNLLGRRLRGAIHESWRNRLELATPIVAIALTLVGA